MKTSVAIIDGFPTVGEMLSMMLENESRYQIVAKISSGLEALRFFESNHPQIVVLDLVLVEASGLEVLRLLRRENIESRVVIFTGTSDRTLIFSALQQQPHGFVHKSESLDALRTALDFVSRGHIYLSAMASKILDDSLQTASKDWNELNNRERIVIQMVAEGFTSRDIATKLFISARTVESYRINAMKKLKLQNVAAVTKYAIKQGLVGID